MTQRSGEIQHYLLVFDHDRGKLVELISFGTDGDRAVSEYGAKERELQELSRGSRPRLEIVLIGSDSLETVKRTHANYFSDTAGTSKYFDFAELN